MLKVCPVDSNVLLDRLRERIRIIQADGPAHDYEDVEDAVSMFRQLDNWILSGGPLPDEWANRKTVTQ